MPERAPLTVHPYVDSCFSRDTVTRPTAILCITVRQKYPKEKSAFAWRLIIESCSNWLVLDQHMDLVSRLGGLDNSGIYAELCGIRAFYSPSKSLDGFQYESERHPLTGSAHRTTAN